MIMNVLKSLSCAEECVAKSPTHYLWTASLDHWFLLLELKRGWLGLLDAHIFTQAGLLVCFLVEAKAPRIAREDLGEGV